MVRVEWDAELAVLRASLAACVAGTGGAVVIRGPVGVGKTELLRSLAREAAAAGVAYVGATGSHAEQAIPMGAMTQIFAGLNLPDEEAGRVQRLLEAGALTSILHDSGDESIAQVVVPVLHGLTSIMLAVAERAPLLIGVDDAHFVDAASLQCLRYLVRRIDRARVLVVFNDTTTVRPTWPMIWAELLSQPHRQLIRLNMLSPVGVAAVLRAEAIDLEDNTPATLYEATGGSPLLLMALIEEIRVAQARRRAGHPEMSIPGPGHAFGQAVLNCLVRSDPSLLPLVRAVAVLDEAMPVAFLAELLDWTTSAAAWAVDAATEAGLVTNGRLRHRRSREVVLDLMGPQERAALHARVAELLDRAGATPVRVARHWVAARRPMPPGSVPVLLKAAEQALAENDTGLALDCLRLADRENADPGSRVGIEGLLVRAKWRLDPVFAARHVDSLLDASRAGKLSGEDSLALVAPLEWYGRPAEAEAVLAQVEASAGAEGHHLAVPLHNARMALAYWYPGVVEPVKDGSVASSARPATTANMKTLAAGIVQTVYTCGYTDEAVADAKTLLQSCRLEDHTLYPILIALETLIFADCLDAAASWCDRLLGEARRRSAPTWLAVLFGLRAMVSHRQGELTEAERHARAGLLQIPPRGLGVLIGIPLSVLIMTATRAGENEQALSHLNMAVPDAMFQTTIGLHYRRARGHYYLTCGSHEAAIEDFEACGDLMRRWGPDLPGLVPWRTDLAEARLAGGFSAGTLAADQIDRLGTQNARTRGITLRVLAASSELSSRPPVLREAVELLQASGDQLELADALAELSNAQHALGEFSRARVIGRQAKQLASQVMVTVPEQYRPPAETAPAVAPVADDLAIFELSEAECRVASLAAQGCTNRQIARKLFITVSTVEQHLTRVYRKLQINSRSDLPTSLLSWVGDPT
ncbi:AAA family ATPase [Streptomyces sp. NBC_01754]|uniref:helix-turn-helix transcriptional regulator n=1 Tax=Streptomyces sp. NBC_01754 TaxID=2975930 RepID=UPI002DDA1313|nr:AAA family ATPase [Streptomyces sp. NBC_01754]WSC90877.1 AAA family ATPase [Streptomyces sp. NBC_01754]WSC96628.1 AAA family ATPase [Streptomyces sp. NBC_01754]